MQALEVGHVRYDDAQQVVEFARHQVALHDLGDAADRLFERSEFAVLLAVQANADKDVAGQPGFRLVEQRDIAVDDAAVFERAHPAQAGRLGEVDQACELHVADAPVVLQHLENGLVVAVDVHGRNLRLKWRLPQKMP